MTEVSDTVMDELEEIKEFVKSIDETHNVAFADEHIWAKKIELFEDLQKRVDDGKLNSPKRLIVFDHAGSRDKIEPHFIDKFDNEDAAVAKPYWDDLHGALAIMETQSER